MSGSSYTLEEQYQNLLDNPYWIPEYLLTSGSVSPDHDVSNTEGIDKFKKLYKNFSPDFRFKNGRTPLSYWISPSGFRPKVVKHLLEYGVDPNAILGPSTFWTSNILLHNILDTVTYDDKIHFGLIFEPDVEILIEIFTTVLKYGGDPLIKYKGRTVKERVENLIIQEVNKHSLRLRDGFQKALEK